jgi:hypothetical protein
MTVEKVREFPFVWPKLDSEVPEPFDRDIDAGGPLEQSCGPRERGWFIS